MSLFKKIFARVSGEKKFVNVSDVFVAEARIISSYNDGSGAGARYVEWFYLVQELNGEYKELFTGAPMKKESDTVLPHTVGLVE